ncbi:LysR family transcriptional regulator [Sorangium sp. So ce388]|uniref:LysR family transcriptional regulator n=1 Tax=Sorangium sp. So ce388 TaxID=3133309 RepID=UPI003F5BC6A1
MQAFVRVVEGGTFTRAADSLGLLTRPLQQLEDQLRTRLLHRTTRRVTVTPEGVACDERALRMLADLEDEDAETKWHPPRPGFAWRTEVHVKGSAPHDTRLVISRRPPRVLAGAERWSRHVKPTNDPRPARATSWFDLLSIHQNTAVGERKQ